MLRGLQKYCASVPSKINHPSCIPTVKIILEKWLLLLFDVLKPVLRSSFVTIYVRNYFKNYLKYNAHSIQNIKIADDIKGAIKKVDNISFCFLLTFASFTK